MIAAAPINRRLRRLLAGPVRTAATVPGADAYRKHFPPTAHGWFLLWHGLSAQPSLRQAHACADADPTFWTRLSLPPTGISRSQLARSSTRRPPRCLAQVFTALPRRAQIGPRPWEAVHLIDSTFLTLSAKLAPWCQYSQYAPGLRVHTGYDLAGAIPSHLSFSLAHTHDLTAFQARDWGPLRGWMVIMDLGYYSHRTFAALGEAGVSWLCPLQGQARVTVTASRAVDPSPTPAGDVVLADETIPLGRPHNRTGAVLAGVRQVTSRNVHGEVRTFVTDRHDLTAADIVTLSRQRWQIELFFRWLKHQLGSLQPLGSSPQAVLLTLWLAVIVAVLLVLLIEERPAPLSDIAWVRALGHILFSTIRNSS